LTVKPFPLRHPVEASQISGKPRNVTLVPSQDEVARIADAYGLLGLSGLRGEFELRPWRREGVAVKGVLHAVATQACVVTLKPVEQVIDEPFEMRFDPRVETSPEATGEIDVDAFADDPPDPLDNGRIDLGAILCEQLTLALDPFPRAPDAEVPEEFRPDEDEKAEERPSPFASLAGLRKTDD
jgi:uncharacterized metal-binding protein YceD (DUF177 family)